MVTEHKRKPSENIERKFKFSVRPLNIVSWSYVFIINWKYWNENGKLKMI